MSKRSVSTVHAPAPVGPYSQAVVDGGIVATAGQVGIDPRSGLIAGTDVRSQTRQALANLAAVLAAAGASLEDVIRVGVFLTDRGDFAAMNEVYEQVMPSPWPARTTVFVGLGDELLVEIDALARSGESA